ncbi:MAG: ABC transporter substrate-binding protein [Clostridia bacterium]|nr:ABC transporter substrate-binding protein [Clostridia bacterium]
MKNTKKILSLVMAAIMMFSCLALFSCGEKDDGKYNIGILQLAPHPALDAATEGFKAVLVEAFGEENVTFDFVNAQGDNNVCTTSITNFVEKKVDLIMANATAALQAAYNGTTTIPILGTSVTDYPTALNLDREAYTTSGGVIGKNVSGTSDLAPIAEQAAMLLELYPDAQNVGLFYCSAEPNSQYQIDVITPILEDAGKTCTVYKFSDSNDVVAVAEKASSSSDVIYIPTDNTAANCTEAILGAIGNTPAITGEAGLCSGCGVATLSISYDDLGRKTGEMAVKILKGEANVEEMAVEFAASPEKMYNKARCEALGMDIAALEAKGYKAIEG